MLLVPLAVGAALAGRWDMKLSLLLVAVLCLFVARNPLYIRLRTPSRRFSPEIWSGWLSIGALGFFLSVGLLTAYELWSLAFFGGLALLSLIAGLFLIQRRLDRTVAGEMLGIATLTMTAPAAYYVATGSLGRDAWLLWLFNTLFFSTSIFYVRMKVEAAVSKRRGSKRDWYARSLLAYLGVEFALVAALAGLGLAPALAPLTLLPIAAQTVVAVWTSGAAISLKRIGFIQLGHSLLFALLLALVYHI